MAYVRKTRDEYDVEGDFGFGWEVVTGSESFRDARMQLASYRENAPEWPYRIRKVRVRIEA